MNTSPIQNPGNLGQSALWARAARWAFSKRVGRSPRLASVFIEQHTMTGMTWALLAVGGFLSGILAGFLGIGGGTVLVPILVAFGYTPVQAVATSSLAILITSISGTVQNWRMGYFDAKRILGLGLPALLTAQLGVVLANQIPAYLLLAAFGILLLVNIYLVQLRKRLTAQQASQTSNPSPAHAPQLSPVGARLITGGLAGLLAGLFGVGGGVIMVPLQMLFLHEPIKVAIQTSLGVVVLTAISASLGHLLSGNVVVAVGVLLGFGGLLGAQVSTRLLPKLPDALISLIFRLFLGLLSIYIFWQAWQTWDALPKG